MIQLVAVACMSLATKDKEVRCTDLTDCTFYLVEVGVGNGLRHGDLPIMKIQATDSPASFSLSHIK